MRWLFKNNWFIGIVTGVLGNAAFSLIQLTWPSTHQLSGIAKVWVPLVQPWPIPIWFCLLVAGYFVATIARSIVALVRSTGSRYKPSELEQIIIQVIRYLDDSVTDEQISNAVHTVGGFTNVGREKVRVAIENLCEKQWLEIIPGWQGVLYYQLNALSMVYADEKGWAPKKAPPKARPFGQLE